MHTKSSLCGDWGCGKPPSVAIPRMVIFLIFVFIDYLLGDFPRIKKISKNIKNHLCGVCGFGRDFFAYFETLYVRWFAKNKILKNAHKIIIAWWLGVRKSSFCGDSTDSHSSNVLIYVCIVSLGEIVYSTYVKGISQSHPPTVFMSTWRQERRTAKSLRRSGRRKRRR